MWIKGSLRWISDVSVRFVHTSRHLQAVEKSSLSKLRKKTGFPFINCKKALEKFNNDIKQAEAWLREEAQKEGWAKATKLQDRPMSQGLIGVIVDHQRAAMIEVNCETDFVARNPNFQKLVSRAAAVCLHHGQQSGQEKALFNKSSVGELILESGEKLSDLVALEVGSIGENMAVRRAIYLAAAEGAHIGSYVHSTGPHIVQDNKCIMGRFGSLVTFNQSEQLVEDKLGVTELGRQLCQHVVGMNPTSLGMTADEDVKTDDKRMLHQEFLLEPTLTVAEYLEQNSATVNDFVRFECGEELEDDGK